MINLLDLAVGAAQVLIAIVGIGYEIRTRRITIGLDLTAGPSAKCGRTSGCDAESARGERPLAPGGER
jgi:hypothetical protein